MSEPKCIVDGCNKVVPEWEALSADHHGCENHTCGKCLEVWTNLNMAGHCPWCVSCKFGGTPSFAEFRQQMYSDKVNKDGSIVTVYEEDDWDDDD